MPELNNIQNENTKELHRNHEEVIEREFSAIMDRGNEIEDNTTGEIGDEIKFNQLLLEKINGLPAKPGVYQYKNRAGKIIYVGKAIKLRNRVKSYFLNGKISKDLIN